jgi:sugar lactone lactonase YvrE
MRRIIVSVFVLVTLVLIASCQHDITDPESTDPANLSHSTTNSNVRVLKLAGDDLDNAAALHGATGLAMLDRDHLLVGSLLGLEIATVDIHSGHIDSRLRPADGVEGPDDVIVAPDGSIYWSNFWTGEVRRLTPEGDLSSVLVGRGAGPLAISPSGDVYVARRFLGQGLYALDPELTLAPVELLDAGEIGGLAFDASGRLFASSWTHGGIMRIWIENEVPTATWVTGGFNVPAGIVFEPDGCLLVAEFVTGEVWRLELPVVNSHYDPFDGAPPDEKDWSNDRTRVTTLSPGILSIALDPRGHFFVSNGQNGSVTKVYSYGYKREVC